MTNWLLTAVSRSWEGVGVYKNMDVMKTKMTF